MIKFARAACKEKPFSASYCQRYLDQNELVILRQRMEPWQTLGELHHMLHGRRHAQSYVVPQHRARVSGLTSGRGCDVITSATCIYRNS